MGEKYADWDFTSINQKQGSLLCANFPAMDSDLFSSHFNQTNCRRDSSLETGLKAKCE
jgi:hypothetical protein